MPLKAGWHEPMATISLRAALMISGTGTPEGQLWVQLAQVVHWNRVSINSSERSIRPSITSLSSSILPRAFNPGRSVAP